MPTMPRCLVRGSACKSCSRSFALLPPSSRLVSQSPTESVQNLAWLGSLRAAQPDWIMAIPVSARISAAIVPWQAMLELFEFIRTFARSFCVTQPPVSQVSLSSSCTHWVLRCQVETSLEIEENRANACIGAPWGWCQASYSKCGNADYCCGGIVGMR